ncbi:hypothetical protein MaudCBS49596_004099 [Microsporum audouinii]
MEQEKFVYIAPHRREMHPIVIREAEIIFRKGVRGIFMLLAVPTFHIYPDYVTSGAYPGSWKKMPYASIQPSNCFIARLPPELVTVIIKNIDIIDVLHLGLSCRYLWSIGWHTIIRFAVSTLGLWAGTPIVCMGHRHRYGSNAPYPRGLLSGALLAEMDRGLRRNSRARSLSMGMYPLDKPLNLGHLAFDRFDRVRDIAKDNLPPDLTVPAKLHLNTQRYSPYDLRYIINQCPYTLYWTPPGEIWVLRSQTAREYIRSTSIAMHTGYIRGPFILGIGFSEAICHQTLWNDNVYRGDWAGHALDIVPMSRLRKDGGRWKDIGDRVAEQIYANWRSFYGETWREEAVKLGW